MYRGLVVAQRWRDLERDVIDEGEHFRSALRRVPASMAHLRLGGPTTRDRRRHETLCGLDCSQWATFPDVTLPPPTDGGCPTCTRISTQP